MGIVNVQGMRFNPEERGPRREFLLPNISSFSRLIEEEQVDTALADFFNRVYDAAGMERGQKRHGFPGERPRQDQDS